MSSESGDDRNYINEGDFIVVKSENVLRLVELKKNKPYFLGKRKANLFSSISHSYGSFFEILSDGNLKKASPSEVDESMTLKMDGGGGGAKDNRSLVDTGHSQKLTTDDIEAYKAQGLPGQEMIKMIVENSSSFREKTAFAKEKYLRKKQSKYMKFVQLLRPNIRLLAEMYYSQGPLKICNLRMDSLSQMLAFCNVMSGGKYMILETVNGLLTAAVIERVGGKGCVVQMHLGPFSIYPCQHAIKALNLPAEKLQSILFNIDLKTAMKELYKPDGQTDPSMNADAPSTNSEEKRKSDRESHLNRAREILCAKEMDSLLVAVKNHPASVLPLIDFLSCSRPFAVFSMYQEPLVDCYVALKQRGDIIFLNISETWFRRYQVLPDRTHPCYSMSGSGGFLLTGIKVESKPSQSSS